MKSHTPRRCAWCTSDPVYISYHDEEWGVPLHDDRRLLEMLILEGAQAGLSWITVLRKRPAYRQAFRNFDPDAVARYGEADVKRLLNDPGIIRNRLKIESAIRNAQGFLTIMASEGSFDAFLWRYVDGQPRQNRWRALSDIPAESAESRRMSRDLKRLGFNFVGPTICYAFMQAVGMVNDHTTDCFRHRQVSALR